MPLSSLQEVVVICYLRRVKKKYGVLNNNYSARKKCLVDLTLREKSSRSEVFSKKVVLRNFAKFTGKHLCQLLFFNKVVGMRPATLLKKRLWHSCFPANFTKFLRTPFLTEHLWWLLLERACAMLFR